MLTNRKYRIGLILLVSSLACGRFSATPSPKSPVVKAAPGDERDVHEASLDIDAPRPNVMVADLESRDLFFILPSDKDGNSQVGTLSLTSNESSYFDQASRVPDVAWPSGLASNLVLTKSRTHMYFTKDTANGDGFNVFRVNLKNPQIEKLTNSPYVPGYALSPDERFLVYSSRRQLSEGSPVEIRLLDLASGEDRLLFADDAMEVKFPWASFTWSHDQRTIYTQGQYGQDRRFGTLVKFNVDGNPNPEVLLPKTAGRELLLLSPSGASGSHVFFTSPESGSRSVMALNLETLKVSTVFRVDGSNIFNFAVVERNSDRATLIAVADGIRGSRIAAISLQDENWTPKSVTFVPFSTTRVLDASVDRAIIAGSGALDPSIVVEVDLKASNYKTLASIAPQSLEKAIHCQVEEHFFKTHDNLTYVFDGEKKQGEIYARLYKPKVTSANPHRLAVVQAFYGGANRHNSRIQGFCAAGVTVLSPAVRGSIEVGAAFEQLNDGDLGGKEILDGQYAGKWLMNHLDLKPEQIGVWGHSHGGYAVQRHLTFPTSEGTEAFDWGFGIAESGFSSIRNAYELSNIKAWFTKEAGGNPENSVDLARWEDRSPINSTQNLRAPLLMIHGTADRRVPFELSSQMLKAAQATNKGHLVELKSIEGAGHVLEEWPVARQAYSAILQFLNRLPEAQAGNRE